MPAPAHNRRPLARAAESGQAIVEFVFVLPFMVVLLFGIVDFGLAVNNASDLNHVAAQTARRLAVNSDPNFDPVAYAKAATEASVGDDFNTLQVTIGLPSGTTPSQDAAVCVKLSMSRKITVIPGFTSFGPSLPISGRAAMRLEMPANFVGSAGASGASAACS